ncbi:MAG: helix-turn-helix transcriptional regulator [Lachnospiraceae bacterium]|nr:helix-turn-helix transcriptional regulator [Lachnospiraceae bacterium]
MKTQQAVVSRIKGICRERRISVNGLAYLSGVAPSTVKNIMYGNSANTGVVTIAKLCNGLEIPLRDFFNDDMFGEELEPEIE